MKKKIKVYFYTYWKQWKNHTSYRPPVTINLCLQYNNILLMAMGHIFILPKATKCPNQALCTTTVAVAAALTAAVAVNNNNNTNMLNK